MKTRKRLYATIPLLAAIFVDMVFWTGSYYATTVHTSVYSIAIFTIFTLVALTHAGFYVSFGLPKEVK